MQTILKRVNELSGIKESDTGLAPPALWDLAADKQALQSKLSIDCLNSMFTVSPRRRTTITSSTLYKNNK